MPQAGQRPPSGCRVGLFAADQHLQLLRDETAERCSRRAASTLASLAKSASTWMVMFFPVMLFTFRLYVSARIAQ